VLELPSTTTPSTWTYPTVVIPTPAVAAPSSSVSTAVPITPTTGVFGSVGWSNPVKGRITSVFGLRTHPVLGTVGIHAGTDIATKCGTTVRAAAAGVVVWVGGAHQGRTGNQVVISHGNGIITRYGHLLSGTTVVAIGETVGVGQPIAAVGGDPRIDPLGAGNSTGCHLHFEVNLRDGAEPVNAATFLAAHGIAIGVDEPTLAVTLAALVTAPAIEAFAAEPAALTTALVADIEVTTQSTTPRMLPGFYTTAV